MRCLTGAGPRPQPQLASPQQEHLVLAACPVTLFVHLRLCSGSPQATCPSSPPSEWLIATLPWTRSTSLIDPPAFPGNASCVLQQEAECQGARTGQALYNGGRPELVSPGPLGAIRAKRCVMSGYKLTRGWICQNHPKGCDNPGILGPPVGLLLPSPSSPGRGLSKVLQMA